MISFFRSSSMVDLWALRGERRSRKEARRRGCPKTFLVLKSIPLWVEVGGCQSPSSVSIRSLQSRSPPPKAALPWHHPKQGSLLPPAGAHFWDSVKGAGLAEASGLFFHPAGWGLALRLLCLDKKDLGTEAESWEELAWGPGAAWELSAGGVL